MEPILQIVLTQTADGQILIKTDGTASETLTAVLGLLEVAKGYVVAAHQKAEASPIIPAKVAPANGRLHV